MESLQQSRGIDVSEAVSSSTMRAAPWGALAVSLVVHLTLVAISSVIVIAPTVSISNSPAEIAVNLDPVVADPTPVLLQMGEWQPTPSGGCSNPLGLAMDETPVEPRLDISTGSGSVAFGDGTDLSYTDVSGAGGAGGSGGSGGGTGDGHGLGSGSGEGGGFFGLDLAGQRFVFVVDASRSMNHPYPGEAKNRLGRVKIELYNTVLKMTPDQSFFVVFFNSEPIPMPSRGMVRAEPALIRPYLNWIFSARGIGQTNPESALMLALRLNPDKIYFLTDGDFSYRSVRAVREANRNRIPIHTIGFGGQEGEKNLQEIARDSQGTYQFIPEPADEPALSVPASRTAASQVAPAP